MLARRATSPGLVTFRTPSRLSPPSALPAITVSSPRRQTQHSTHLMIGKLLFPVSQFGESIVIRRLKRSIIFSIARGHRSGCRATDQMTNFGYFSQAPSVNAGCPYTRPQTCIDRGAAPRVKKPYVSGQAPRRSVAGESFREDADYHSLHSVAPQATPQYNTKFQLAADAASLTTHHTLACSVHTLSSQHAVL